MIAPAQYTKNAMAQREKIRNIVVSKENFFIHTKEGFVKKTEPGPHYEVYHIL